MRWQIHGVAPRLKGDSLFVGDFRCDGGSRAWRHEVTPHFEIELPRVGVHLREVGRQRHVIDATTAAPQHAGHEYRRAAPMGQPQAGTVLLASPELAEELQLSRLVAPVRLSARAALLHQRLSAATADLETCELALELFARIVEDAGHVEPLGTKGVVPPSWRRLTHEIRQILAVHYAEPLTLERIAELCGASPFHASRVFRAVTGKTLHRELNRLRLHVALYALQQAAGSLTELSLQVGFSSHSHFTSAFRAEFGVPPSWMLRAAPSRC